MKAIKTGKGFLVLFGSIFLLVGLALVAVAVGLRMHQTPEENRVYTEAVITRIESYRDFDRDRQHRVFVSYSVDGQEYETELHYYRSGFREGRKITIYYDKEHPTFVSSDTRDRALPISLLLFGLLSAALGGIVVYMVTVVATRPARLMKKGTRINAVYAGVRCLTNVSINGRHPYVILARAYDPETMQEREFRSQMFMHDPEHAVEQANIQYLPVYLDPRHPKKYYMDVREVEKNV